jgi:hypothetical protein
MNTNNNNRGKRAVRTGRIRKCFWFAEPDASSQAAFSSNAEKCIEVNLSGLPKDKRRTVWEWIQANQPKLAKMLSEDAQFREIKTAFNCQVKVDLPESVCKQLELIR